MDSPRHTLLSGRATFDLDGDGRSFDLDVIEALRAVQQIANDCKAKNLTAFEYLDQFGEWVHEKTGVNLTLGQAESLWDAIPKAYQSFRERRAGLTSGAPTSPSSTASTPPG